MEGAMITATNAMLHTMTLTQGCLIYNPSVSFDLKSERDCRVSQWRLLSDPSKQFPPPLILHEY